jgi:molybdate transport system substrate-binding protein
MKRALLLLLLSLAASAAELRVSAAASLTDVLQELGGFYQQRTGTHVVFNFGASGMLARQIVEGAPADVFVSADERQMDRVPAVIRGRLLSNVLVVIVPSNSTGKIDLRRAERIAIANPETVPAGAYAKEWLIRRGLWSAVAPHLIPTDNVRAALAAVESRNVDAGIVYRTDAKISRRVRVAFEIADGPPISYPGAVLRGAANPADARRFLDFLTSPYAQRVFRRYGFVV